IMDGLKVSSPAGVETSANAEGAVDNTFAASQSVAYDWANDPGVTNAEVVKIGDWSSDDASEGNADGCATLSDTDKAAVTGKILLTKWVADYACGSVKRAADAE